jgi:hypothetical protein
VKYRSKPATIEAMQFTGGNLEELRDFVSVGPGPGVDVRANGEGGAELWVAKSKAWCDLPAGSFVVAEPDGSGFYPCAGDIFVSRWEVAE